MILAKKVLKAGVAAAFAAALMAGCSKDAGGNPNPGGGEETPYHPEFPIFSFVANQTKSAEWYKPQPSYDYVNAHLDESFGKKELYPQLIENLKESGGYFSIYASEVNFLKENGGFLSVMRDEGIRISVEMPGMTQPISGDKLAEAELNGKTVDGTNIFASIFRLTASVLDGRTNPDQKGWFVNKDRKDFIPDMLIFDERQPNLVPEIDPDVLHDTPGTIDQKITAALKYNNMNSRYRKPFNNLLATLREDYALYLQVAKTKWGDKMPKVGIHWNVVVGWEWRDQSSVKEIYAIDPSLYDGANYWHNFYRAYAERKTALASALYKSVDYLSDYIDYLTEQGFKPTIVYMDVDWRYDLDYVKTVLLKHREMLKTKGVQLGINVVEAGYKSNYDEMVCSGTTLTSYIRSSSSNPNVLYGNTLVACTQWLINTGIYEQGMQIRVGSWSPRPYEIGDQINENTPGSLANTANKIYKML